MLDKVNENKALIRRAFVEILGLLALPILYENRRIVKQNLTFGGGIVSFKSARERAGLTVLTASRELKVSPAAIYMWESGETHPAGERLLEIAKLYGCTTDELLKEEE